MALAYVFLTQASADAARTEIDKVEGYPKAGTNVGGGRHVEPTFVTSTHCQPMKHPTLAMWAVLEDVKVRAAIDGKAGIPVPTDLDATWELDAKIVEVAEVRER